MSKDTCKPSVKQPTSSSTSNSEIKILQNAFGRNCSKYKFFFATNDPSIGKVKEEIINDEQILPFDKQNRIFAYLISIEGSTTSNGGDGEGEGNKQSKHSNHHRDDTILPSTTNSSFIMQQPRLQCMSQRYASANNSDYQKYFAKQRAGRIDVTSFPSSDSESTTFFDETEDYRYSTVTDSTTISSRYHDRNPLRGRQHRSSSGLDRASSSPSPSSFSSFNSDSTMTSNIITVTLNLYEVNSLAVTIASRIDETGSSHGIYVDSIKEGSAVAQDGRMEPGDMILQVNDISFEGLSHDDVAEILSKAVQKHGPIKLVVAKCWGSTPRGYFTLPHHEQARPVDPLSRLEHTQAVPSRYHGRNRLRARQHRSSSGLDRASSSSSFSSFNSDSTMTSNIINVTINLHESNFLGVNIASRIDETGSSHGIYVDSINEGSAVAQDGRIEPGDMILQVNDISFEGLSDDDVAEILRKAVQKHGSIKFVVAKCWDSTPRGYFTLPRHEQAHPVDPLSRLEHTQAVPSRYHGRNRLRARQHRSSSGLDRASSSSSSFSSFNSDSTMTSNTINVTLNLHESNFLGVNIASRIDETGSSRRIYVDSINERGAAAQDGRMEPGDMILQVNDISFEGLSDDDVAEILCKAVQKHGPIKFVVAKCWYSTPRGYFTLPRHEQARPVDPLSRLEHRQAVQNTYNNSQQQIVHHPQQQIILHHQQSSLNSTKYMSSTISSTNNTIADNERFDLDLNLIMNSDMDIIVRAMAKPDSCLDIRDRKWLKIPIREAFLGSDIVNWLYENVDGFVNRSDAICYASRMLKAGYITNTVHKSTFSERCYYVFGDSSSQGVSQLTLDEEYEDGECFSD